MPDQLENGTQQTTVVSETSPAEVVRTTSQVQPQTPIGQPQKVLQKKKAIFRTHQIIWYILGIVEFLLAFRMTLKALGANPSSGFTNLIYALSDPLALPFSGIFGVTATNQGNFFEWSTIIAVIVYALIAYAVIQLMQLVKPVSKEEVEQTVDSQ
ncbi:MAG: YggT family protein [Candidatus Levybacteria bacterium]|nr:YggT family protein [Candidatus Levybacteria bacterium]